MCVGVDLSQGEMVVLLARVCEHVIMACMCGYGCVCVTGRWEYEWGLSNNRLGFRLQFHASREKTIKKERRAHQALTSSTHMTYRRR